MVQVIQLHPYNQSYPFGLQKQSPCTYVQLIKQISSQQQLLTYKQNLSLFKSINSNCVILLDSYVKEGNSLQLYYEYQPLSIRRYVEQKLVGVGDDAERRDKFVTKVISGINAAIEEVILVLMGKKVLALLSIDNMAVGLMENIKFFIEPDFQYVEKPTHNQLTQYYSTEKKKLQIQLEQFLEHIFAHTNTKPKQHNKANFIIQGTKLVFANSEEEINRQSSMSGVSVISVQSQNKHQIKLPAYMLKEPKQNASTKQHTSNDSQNNSNNNNPKQKFDIKNILDEKKLQKNQSQFTSITYAKDNNMRNLQNFDKSPTKSSLYSQTKTENQTTKQTSRQRQKDVKNYFENNDDFNKDASFYPEEFIKEDSIAEFDGYEDELEKELEDLKNKKLEAEQIANTSKNRLSMVPNTPLNPNSQLNDQRMNKTPTSQQTLSTVKLLNKNPSNQFPQNAMNSSGSREQDTSQEQQKQKKKYKVTITTSHLVDVEDEDADLKGIEQELIEDIKKGAINGGNEGRMQVAVGQKEKESVPNFPAHMLKGHNRQTHSPNTSQTQPMTSSSLPLSNCLDEHSSSIEQTPSKHQTLQSAPSGTTQQQAPDIKKIIQKIKNNSQNHQFINGANSLGGGGNTSSVNTSGNLSQNPSITGKLPQQQRPINDQFYQQSQPHSAHHSHQQQDSRSQSHLSSQGNNLTSTSTTCQNTQKKEQQQSEKEYLDKIQKAKLKAEEIMKLVKDRKGQ